MRAQKIIPDPRSPEEQHTTIYAVHETTSEAVAYSVIMESENAMHADERGSEEWYLYTLGVIIGSTYFWSFKPEYADDQQVPFPVDRMVHLHRHMYTRANSTPPDPALKALLKAQLGSFKRAGARHRVTDGLVNALMQRMITYGVDESGALS